MKSLFLRGCQSFLSICLGIFCFSGFKVSADCGYYENYSNECCQQGNFYVTLEALYWQPMHYPIFVARRSMSDVNPAPRDELYLNGTYDPGVRARLGYLTCNCFTDIAYLYFHSDEKHDRSIDNFNKMEIAGAPPSYDTEIYAKGRSKFRYQNVDGRYGQFFCRCGNNFAFYYANARWVKVDFKNQVRAVPVGGTDFLDFFKQDSHFNGGGFGLGLGGHYVLCGKLGIAGNVGIMAIIGQTSLKNFNSNFDLGFFVTEAFLKRSENWTHVVPALDFRLGIDYAFCWCCFNGKIEVGYELDYYANILRYASSNLVSTPNSERIPFFEVQDLGFAGPYFNLTFMF